MLLCDETQRPLRLNYLLTSPSLFVTVIVQQQMETNHSLGSFELCAVSCTFLLTVFTFAIDSSMLYLSPVEF